jgi:hypothetical protein
MLVAALGAASQTSCLTVLKLQQVEILVMNWKTDSDEAAENDKIEQDTEATAHALVHSKRISTYLFAG